MLIEETAQRAYGGVSSCQVPKPVSTMDNRICYLLKSVICLLVLCRFCSVLCRFPFVRTINIFCDV